METNNLFLELLGYCREEVLDTPLARYYTDESKKRLIDRQTQLQI